MAVDIRKPDPRKNYLLVLLLKSPLSFNKKELHVPFYAIDKRSAVAKAESVTSIWDDDLDHARLFKLEEIDFEY